MKFSLDSINKGLSDFLGAVDGNPASTQSSTPSFTENRYNEKGFYTVSSFSDVEVHNFKILWQEPTATVIVKKKMFSSLAEYNKDEYMDPEERMFLMASKRLFSNKCKQIAYFEQLTKLEELVKNSGQLNDLLLPVVMGAVDSLSAIANATGNSNITDALAPTNKYIQQIKNVLFFNNPYPFTTWISDNAAMTSNLINQAFSHETGVMELTNFTSSSTETGLNFTDGRCSINFEDPYHLARITQEDIELAISDVSSGSGLNPINNQMYSFSLQQTLGTISELTGQFNSERTARGASPITFNQYPTAKVKVTATLDRNGVQIQFSTNIITDLTGIGSSITIDSNFVQASNPVTDALTPDEEQLFGAIIRNIYNYISSQQNYQSAQVSHNKAGNFLRRRMYMNHLGKHIVQTNDIVYVYMNSRTKYDNVVNNSIQGTFDSLSILSQMQQSVNDLQNTFNSIFNPSSNINLQLEKSMYVSSDFPSYLWLMFRNYFIESKDGTCVFVGLANVPSSNFTADSGYTFSVTASPQSKYFKMGPLSLNPGVSTDNGALLDPLTLYKTRYDQVYSNFSNDLPLLDENIKRLRTGKIKYKAGKQNGQTTTPENIKGGDKPNRTPDDQTIFKNDFTEDRDVVYAPDGLVYQWKQGIGVRVQFGTSLNNDPAAIGNINIQTDPFAKQDVFNALALMITGEPYNYLTYYQAAKDANPQQQQPFYNYLQTQFQKRNVTWGNFRPYKTFSNEKQTLAMIMSQFSIQQSYTDINNILTEYTNVQSQAIMNATTVGSTHAIQVAQNLNQILAERKSELEASISTQINSINQNLKASNNIILNGNDISVSNQDTDPEVTKQLRRKVDRLTRRLPWKVRSNTDANLFIVEDLFDKDQDIMAFAQDIVSATQFYSSSFDSVDGKITNVAELLYLEVFCDTQGHIRLRVPQYNKIPSSVFFKLLGDKHKYGTQIFPQFMEDLITNKIQYFAQLIEVEEDFIRLICTLFNSNTDKDCVEFINYGSSNSKQYNIYAKNLTSATFNFLSSDPSQSNNYASTLVNIESLLKNTPTSIFDSLKTVLTDVTKQSQNNNLFNIAQQANIVTNVLGANAVGANIDSSTFTTANFSSPRLTAIEQHLLHKAGKTVNLDDYLNTTGPANTILNNPKQAGINFVKAVQDISMHVANRQKYVTALSAALKSYKDSVALDASTSTQLNVLFQNTNSADIPDIYENLIEDENYDDLGPGSGKRFVIENECIKSLTIKETEPEHTHVTVMGTMDGFNSLKFDSGNYTRDSNGNSMTTAEAVDYDMWRQYGFKSGSTENRPYFTDAKKHCAPFAAMMLNRARMNIIRGEIKVVGNEYYQPGDVIYIKSENMLFYVSSVQHNFSWTTSFDTTLNLIYGHVPGEYIPNPFDIIGKMLYNNKYGDEITNYKEQNDNNEISIGALINPSFGSGSSSGISSTQYTDYTNKNKDVLEQILNQALVFTNRWNLGDNQQKIIPRIEIRQYTDSSLSSQTTPNGYYGNFITNMSDFANSISSYLIGENSNPTLRSTNPDQTKYLPEKDPLEGKPIVNIIPIDLSDKENTKSPSKYAYAYATSLQNSLVPVNKVAPQTYISNPQMLKNTDESPETMVDYDSLNLALIAYVLDVYVVFETTTTTPLQSQNAT
jgi:hypothetical protein